jgi:hypothetical protein
MNIIRFHRLEVIATFVVELPMTFLVFGEQWLRLFAFIGFVGLNVFINITGNYGFLGLLTCIQCIPLIEDWMWREVLPHWMLPPPQYVHVDVSVTVISILLVLPYVLISMVPLVSTFHGSIPWKNEFFRWLSSHPSWGTSALLWESRLDGINMKIVQFFTLNRLASKFVNILTNAYVFLAPLRIINKYAKFGTMRTERWEMVIEGSNDLVEWRAYEFKYKPGRVDKRPPFVPLHLPGPYHLHSV